MPRQKIKDDLYYTINQISKLGYRVNKFDSDSEMIGCYEILQQGPKDFYCTCPGYHNRSHCKHLDIFKKFREADKLGGGHVYSFRNDTFSEMLENLA